MQTGQGLDLTIFLRVRSGVGIYRRVQGYCDVNFLAVLRGRFLSEAHWGATSIC